MLIGQRRMMRGRCSASAIEAGSGTEAVRLSARTKAEPPSKPCGMRMLSITKSYVPAEKTASSFDRSELAQAQSPVSHPEPAPSLFRIGELMRNPEVEPDQCTNIRGGRTTASRCAARKRDRTALGDAY